MTGAAGRNGARDPQAVPPRTVVYACTRLDYDQIFSPVAPTPGVEFVLFADRRPRLVRGWRWRPLPEVARSLSPTLANRYAKFFPERILPEAEISVYVDANTLILSDLTPLIAEFAASGADIGLFRHRERASLAEELAFGRQVGKIPAADAAKGEAQLAHYREAGLPPDVALTENAIIFRRHGRPALGPAMELWWAQLEEFTKRDQLSLPYVLYRSRSRGEALGLELQVREPLLHALPAPARALERPQRVPEEQAALRPGARPALRRAALPLARRPGLPLAAPPLKLRGQRFTRIRSIWNAYGIHMETVWHLKRSGLDR